MKLKLEQKVYFGLDPNRNIVTEPYWEKRGVIQHIEETEFPLEWRQLYRKGYRIEYRMIFQNPNWGL